jgi:hypothetical protein
MKLLVLAGSALFFAGCSGVSIKAAAPPPSLPSAV